MMTLNVTRVFTILRPEIITAGECISCNDGGSRNSEIFESAISVGAVYDRLYNTKMSSARGLLLVNTGNGKGKSTAAFGVAFRAIGHGLTVSIIQFIKGKWKTGEMESARRLGLELMPMGKGFTWESKNIEEDKELMRQAWTIASEKILSGNYDLIILDELNYVLGYGYIPVDDVVRMLRSRPPYVHVVLTGRNAPDEILAIADCVTEMRDIKHPYRSGIPAQRGIDF